MDPLFADTFLIDATRAFNFFSTTLGDVVEQEASGSVSREEFLYVTSILAHYALVESGNAQYLPIPGTLRSLHDLFVMNLDTWHDADLMETAAAQTLMLTGYFAGAMRARHNLRTYVGWGRFFFGRAASGTEGKKQSVLQGMSRHFPLWRGHLEQLHTQLWESRLLLDTPPAAPRAPRGVRS
jgi:hypothetical protein